MTLIAYPVAQTTRERVMSAAMASSCASNGLRWAASGQTPGSKRLRASRAPRAEAAAEAAAAGGGGEKAKVAVFVSGGGSNLRALHAAMADGRVNAQLVAVVSNVPSCGGVAWAQEQGIPTLTYPAKKGDPASGLSAAELVSAVRDTHGAEYVLLAGQGLTLVHFSAQLEPYLTHKSTLHILNTP